MTEHQKSEYERQLDQLEEWQKAQRHELYWAFIPELTEARTRCSAACDTFNTSPDRSRRNLVKMWREITCDTTNLPPPSPTSTDDTLFTSDPWICAPIHIDYGFNVHLSPNTFINFNATFVDTCPIKIGARTLVGPNCSFYTGIHPIDPAVRNGLEGPESGKPIAIGEDCWFGGNVIVLPGVTIGRGVTVGAGSVVTKDVPAFHVVAGNPARILRKIETELNTGEEQTAKAVQ